MDIWFASLLIASLVLISITHWIYRWRNPKYEGKVLPPGSMGLPIIGETLGFLLPSPTLDVPHFLKKRMKRYGPVFKTNLVGHPVVVSTNAEFSYRLFLNEGKLVEMWYMDSFSEFFGPEIDVSNMSIRLHKHVRNSILAHYGVEALKGKLLPVFEDAVNRALQNWSNQPEVDLRTRSAAMALRLSTKLLLDYDLKESEEYLSCRNFLQGMMAIPLNVPGTNFYRCLQTQKELGKIIAKRMEERKRSYPKGYKGDYLDGILEDMEKESFMTHKYAVNMTVGAIIATLETISVSITLAVKLLTENPSFLPKLVEEHERILKEREAGRTGLTWKEYKSMTFTNYVLNETLRMGSIAPGILRRALTDIDYNGYTIPKGWTIFVVPTAIQLNPEVYKDPLAFNPLRWEDMGSISLAKHFMVFGGGSRTCAGAEYSRLLLSVFLHTLVTKYRWTKTKGGEVSRSPALGFDNGYRVKVELKNK